MNRLLTPNGGMPLELDDFNFIQDAYKEVIKAAFEPIVKFFPTGLSSFATGNFIISGCEATDIGGGNSSISAGLVYIDSEILYAPAVASYPTANLYNSGYKLLAYNDPAGNELFEDGVTRDTYEVRVAQHFTLGGPSVKFATFLQGFRYVDLLSRIAPYSERDILAMNNPLSNSWAIIGGGFPEELLIIKKFATVQFRGAIYGGTLSSLAFTLSAGFRPKLEVKFVVPYGDDGIARIDIATNGEVFVYAVKVPTTGSNIYLDSINFTIE